MAAIDELEVPDFLKVNDVDDIHTEMLELIPDEYDKSEGGHLWNFTRPTALIESQQRGQVAPGILELIWPKFSYGEYTDLHAELRNMFRKEALNATGYVTFTGVAGTVIPAGYTVSTESKNDILSQDYLTTEQCTISDDGTVTVGIKAAVAGSVGNTAANTIVVNSSGYQDIESITNALPVVGGINEETDEALIDRIQEYDRTQGDSNIGNPSDYKRWAESVPGTGTANVIRSTDTSGIVTIILTDGNGQPASTSLCENVYNYIISPDNESLRLAPCGANLSVIPPSTLTITVSAAVVLTSGTIESVTSELAKGLKNYFSECIDNGEIIYNSVSNVLGDIDGVYDYSNLKVNNGQSNIILAAGVYPVIETSNITLTLSE